MDGWHERFDSVTGVRGLGAMLAIELTEGGQPAPELATRVADAAAKRGLLILKAGIHGNCIRVLVPLVISDAELEEALDVWEEALEAVSA
jgi:4-aminobutyrate aminotransferase / (S)-3-amino-2-methylpropionate transaminase / 5-aminovalerate transaminase